MPIHSRTLNLYYYDMPKVACTSVKTFFHGLDTGRTLRHRPVLPLVPAGVQKRAGLMHASIHVQPGYRSCSWLRADPPPEGAETLTLVRDPILRLHSAWKNKANRASFAARGEVRDLWNMGLDPDPDFAAFIDNLDAYRLISRPARVHTYRYSYHLGPDISHFEHVFRLEEMAGFEAFLSERLGRPARIGRENATASEKRDDHIGPVQVDRLLADTKPDYDWLGGLYDPDAALARLRG